MSSSFGSNAKLTFETRAVHDEHGHSLNSHSVPIFQTSTFTFDSPEDGRAMFAGEKQGHIYTRIGNPTVEAFESLMANLEEGAGAIGFGSGMGAITGATLSFLKSGDHVIIGDTLYGPSTHLFNDVFGKFGIITSIVDTSVVSKVAEAIKTNTKMIFLETPANPTGKISDIRAISELGHAHGALTVVDNTFSTPYFQRPLVLGADSVVHSLTKYINGHGDVVGGVVVCKSALHAKIVRNFRKDTGACLAPFDSWLVIRGIRTLACRMEQLQKNGLVVARFLQAHPDIETVMHPGLPDFPNHDVAERQQSGYGSTFSFTCKGGFEAAKKLMENIHLCTCAVSLGGVDTLIEHPASMTHASVPESLMLEQGLTRNLIRISVGLENPQEICQDLNQALAATHA